MAFCNPLVSSQKVCDEISPLLLAWTSCRSNCRVVGVWCIMTFMWRNFVLYCYCYDITISRSIPILIRVASQVLGQSYNCPGTREVLLKISETTLRYMITIKYYKVKHWGIKSLVMSWPIPRDQIYVGAQLMRDDVILQRRLSLVGRIHKVVSNSIHNQRLTPWAILLLFCQQRLALPLLSLVHGEVIHKHTFMMM